MNIIDRLEKINDLAQLARNDGSLREDLIKVDRTTKRVAALTVKLENISVAYGEIWQLETIACSDLHPKMQSVLATLDTLAELAITKQNSSIDSDFVEMVESIEKSVKSIEKSLVDLWSLHRNGHQKPSIDRDLLKIFERAGLDVGELLEKYDDAERRLKHIEEIPLPGAGAVNYFTTSIEDLKKVSEGLSGIVPDDVAKFFRLADNIQGAPLSAFTDEVRHFLTEHRISERYSIRGRK